MSTYQFSNKVLRTDIQALRGYAVSLVLLYHAELGDVRGGFLGVDIFFVISGFLITSMILKDLEKGNFRFSKFYWRRAKRLLPSAYVVFFLTAIVSPFVLNAKEANDFLFQMIGSVTFTANIFLLLQSGYFAGAADLKPLLHVWSLSIEEQYYLLLPAVLIVTPRRYVKLVLLTLMVLSLLLCLLGSLNKPEWTFYLLPTRWWELGVGSLGAMWSKSNFKCNQFISKVFWLSLITLAVVPIFPTGFPHPGLDTILVCVSTLVVILRNHPKAGAIIPVVWLANVGDISYSLYLTHWPLFAFLKNASVAPMQWQISLLTLLLTILLSVLLYRYVEVPIRFANITPRPLYIFFGLVMTGVLILLPFIFLNQRSEGPDFSYLRRPNDGFDKSCAYDTSGFVPKKECRSSEEPSVIVWGDSYAMHLVSGINSVWPHGIVQATMGICGPFKNLAPISNVFYLQPWSEACLKFNRDVVEYIKETKSIKIAVISSPFKQYLSSIDGKHYWKSAYLDADKFIVKDVSLNEAVMAMNETIDELHSLGVYVVVVAPPPSADFNIGTCVERRVLGKLIISSPTNDCSIPKEKYLDSKRLVIEFLDNINKQNDIKLISFDQILCDANKCISDFSNVPVYVDEGHLTHDASLMLMKKLNLNEVLTKAFEKGLR